MSALQQDHVTRLVRASASAGMTPALRKVSFGIDQAEVATIISESGSAKTTLGKIILNLIPARSGTVTIQGRDTTTFKGAELRESTAGPGGPPDPCSSYNPIDKANRVFELTRGPYYQATGQRARQHKIEPPLAAVALNPGPRAGRERASG